MAAKLNPDALSESQLKTAVQLGSATLHEAAGRIGALPSAIKPLAASMRLAGPAFTVHVPAFDNLWIHRAVYEAREGDVLVVCTSGGIEAGYWGDILNEAAIARRLGGLVIDGGVRDSAGLVRHSFPVFCNGVSIRGTVKDRAATAWLGQPIRIGEIIVRQRDLIVGDADGVVVIPALEARRVLDAAKRRESDETEKLARIRAGERTIDIYGLGPYEL
jgi:4-hydroxy-4-methyl-2-oxoglutarate aldolase